LGLTPTAISHQIKGLERLSGRTLFTRRTRSVELTPDGAKILQRAWLFRANESWTPLVISRGLLYVCQNNPERFGDRPARLLCYDLRGES